MCLRFEGTGILLQREIMSQISEKELPWIGPGRYREDDKSDQVAEADTRPLLYKGESNLEQEIVDEFVRMHAMKKCPGCSCSSGCSEVCRQHCCTNDLAGSCSALLCVLIIGCLLFLTFFSVLSIVPRVTSILERTTRCTLVRFDYQDFDKTAKGGCACHIWCKKYPTDTDYCVKLLVEYTNDEGKQSVRTLTGTETAAQCTSYNYPPCPGRAYTVGTPPYMTYGSTFLCLSHPELLITDIFDLQTLIHVSWPVGVILISLIWLICICCTCGCKYISVRGYPPDIKTIADGLGSKGIFTIENLSEADRSRIVHEWKTVCVRMVSDDEGKRHELEQTGASVSGKRAHDRQMPQVQVHQHPQVHQAQVYQEQVPQASRTISQMPQRPIPQAHVYQHHRPPAYVPPAYEGLSPDPTSKGPASHFGVNEHVPEDRNREEEEGRKHASENQVSQEEDENDEPKTLEEQPGEHLSQEQVPGSTEETAHVSDSLGSINNNEGADQLTAALGDSVEQQRDRESETEKLMGQGQIDLTQDYVPYLDYSESTHL